MPKNTAAVPTKTTGSSYAGSEFEIVRGFVDEPSQPETVFTDTNIIVDGTKNYSTIKAITAATHTITANPTLSSHLKNNYLTVRYSFAQDCTLTLANFETIGNKTGTVTPIPLGTYDFYFVAGTFGVNLLVKNNDGTAVATPLQIGTFAIEDAQPTRITFTSNKTDITATTFAGFTLADPTKTISSIFINSGSLTGHYFVVSVAYDAGDTSPTIAYDGTDDWTSTADGDMIAFTAQAITNNIVGAAPTLDTITIENAAPTDVVMVFSEVVTGTDIGETLSGTTSTTFASISGSGTNTLTGVLATPAANGETILFSSTGGDIQGTSLPLASITNQSVTNNVGTAYDSNAAALFIRMATAGSEPDATRKGHINDLIVGLKADGVWASLDCLQFYASHAESVSKLNYVKDDNNGTAVSTPLFTIDQGYTGNGTSSYIASGYTPSLDGVALSLDDTMVGAYIRTVPSATSGMHLFGSNRNSTEPKTAIILSQNGVGEINARVNNFILSAVTPDGVFNASLYTVARASSAVAQVYEGSTEIDTDNITSIGLPNREVFILADSRESVPGASGWCDAQVMMFYAGGALSITNLKTRVDTYLTAIGAI